METLNIHIPQLYHLINRIIKELQFSQSANSSMNSVHDLNRSKTFLSAIRVLVGQIGSPAGLDLPESDPVTYTLRPLMELKDIENQVMAHLSLLLKTMCVELVRSQSSRTSSGLNKFDRERCLALCTECEKFINDYAEKVQPLDLVESSPRAPLQGAGLNKLGNA